MKSPRLFIFFMGVCVTFATILLLAITPLRQLKNTAEDLALQWATAGIPISNDIIVVEVRESTLTKFQYRSPLDRDFLSRLLEKLLLSDARKIGIDILFDQATELDKDHRLRAILKNNRDKVIVATGGILQGLSESQETFLNEYLQDAQTGSIVLTQDWQDGMVRHYLTSVKYGNDTRIHLARAMANKTDIRFNELYQRIIYHENLPGKASPFVTYPAEAVLQLPGQWFAGKYVLVGMNLQGIDQFRSPLTSVLNDQGGTLPGVQLHANILNQELSGYHIHESSLIVKIALIFLGAIFGAFVLLNKGSLVEKFSLVLGGTVVILLAGLFVLYASQTVIPSAEASISFLVSAMATSIFVWQHDRSSKLFFRKAWAQYVSPAVVENLIANPENLKIGGERVDASFIFTDIAGFTSLSEKLPVDELSSLLNSYFDKMTDEFRQAGATIDKIIGDAIVGFIGAPLKDEDHPDKAVALALKLRAVSEDFQADAAKKGIEFGRTRIGVNTGVAIIGNFGGSDFFDYTALGDEMNITARLEGANKYIGSSICVSGSTAKRAKKHIFRPVGQLLLEGKAQLIDAWEPVIEGETIMAPLDIYCAAFDRMVDHFDDAIMSFQALHDAYPGDHLIKFHLNRLRSGQIGTILELSK